ncbi:hypothetical protein Leryth_027011 [Lithospermum erythrorhizon]|nr:hypothetical protein Leryth_027011 [Lithospermum erythrorhizon]
MVVHDTTFLSGITLKTRLASFTSPHIKYPESNEFHVTTFLTLISSNSFNAGPTLLSPRPENEVPARLELHPNEPRTAFFKLNFSSQIDVSACFTGPLSPPKTE